MAFYASQKAVKQKKNCCSRLTLSNMIVITHMQLFKCKLNFQCLSYTGYMSSVFNGHYLLASPLPNISIIAESSTELLYIGNITPDSKYRQDLFETCNAFVK